jgi:hypothetical protein
VTKPNRHRVAAIVTAWYKNSHADVIVRKILEGYTLAGEHVASRLEVASLYFDQITPDDIGLGMAKEHGVPIFESVGEAMALGGSGVQVDGVLIIGEHGYYLNNERGQKTYPRRRLFDAAVGAMVGAGRFVPVFVDKHLSQSFDDARSMVDASKRLGFPMLAGSTVPIAWRTPPLEWPLGAPMDEAVVLCYDSLEHYEFHSLEGLQCMAERRTGGETGVASLVDFGPEKIAAARAARVWSPDLEWSALQAIGLSGHPLRNALQTCSHAFQVTYRDGLKGTILYYEKGVDQFAFAGRVGDSGELLACEFSLQIGPPWAHFGLFVRQIENMVLSGETPYPIERTLLTTGMLDAVMTSRLHGGPVIPTPELAITYEPAVDILDDEILKEPPFVSNAAIGWDGQR